LLTEQPETETDTERKEND